MGRLLMERRSEDRLWAGMWQPVTVEREGSAPTRTEIEAELGVRLERAAPQRFTHQTTHREVRFAVYQERIDGAGREASSGQSVSKKCGRRSARGESQIDAHIGGSNEATRQGGDDAAASTTAAAGINAADDAGPTRGVWKRADEIDALALGNPQRRIVREAFAAPRGRDPSSSR
jgi:hypothetical protein